MALRPAGPSSRSEHRVGRCAARVVLAGVGIVAAVVPRNAWGQSSVPPEPPSSASPTSSSAPPAGPSASEAPAPTSSPAPVETPHVVDSAEASGPPGSTASASPPPAPVASGPPPGDLDATELAAIGAVTDTLSHLPGSATVVTEPEIQRLQPFATSEIVRRIPGYYVRDDDGLGLRLNVGARGFDPTSSRSVTVLEDGIPIAMRPYDGGILEYVPPAEQLQRVESVRGTGSILFGPNTMGGVLNFVTAPPPRTETWSLRAFGAYPLAGGAQGTYGNTFGNAAFVATITRRQGVGFRNDPWESTDVVAKFRVVSGPRSDFVVRLGFSDTAANTSSTGLTQPMFENQPAQNPTPYDTERLLRFSGAITHSYRIADDIRLRTLVYGTAFERTQYTQQFDRIPVPNLAYVHITGPEQAPGDSLYFRDSNRADLADYEFFGVEPRLQAGFRVSGFRNELDLGARVLADSANESSGYNGTQYARSPGTVDHAEHREGVALAAYIQDRLFLTDGLRITASFRVEDYSASRRFRRDMGQDVSIAASGTFSQIMPAATIGYATGPVVAWAGVHLGWRPPDLTQALDPYEPMRSVTAEQSMNYEIGARISLARWLRAEVAAFYIDFQNPIVFQQLPTGTFGYTNGDARRNVGGEGMVTANFGRLAHLAANLYLSARYMFVDARYDSGPDAGNVVPYVPAHTVVASAGFDHPIGLAGSVSWLVVSTQFADAANTQLPTIDGRVGMLDWYNVLDLALSYTHRPTGLGLGLTAKSALGYPLGSAFVATRVPDGIQPGGFESVIVTARWDH